MLCDWEVRYSFMLLVLCLIHFMIGGFMIRVFLFCSVLSICGGGMQLGTFNKVLYNFEVLVLCQDGKVWESARSADIIM